MTNTKIKITTYPTIFTTGASKGTLICGIGYNGLNHIGCIIRLLEEIKAGEEIINCRIKILEPGNLIIDFPNVINFINKPITVSKFKGLILFANNFTKLCKIEPCSKRFAVGDKAKVIEDKSSKIKIPSEVEIVSIQKFPDQSNPRFAYYAIKTLNGKLKGKKLDSGLDFILKHIFVNASKCSG